MNDKESLDLERENERLRSAYRIARDTMAGMNMVIDKYRTEIERLQEAGELMYVEAPGAWTNWREVVDSGAGGALPVSADDRNRESFQADSLWQADPAPEETIAGVPIADLYGPVDRGGNR